MASSRMIMKMQQLARMRISGIKDVVIARTMNMTNSGLQRILRLQVYQEMEEAILHGKLSKMDEALASDAALMRRNMKIAVPAALRTMVELALQRRDLKSALAASVEILDRDPDRNFVDARDSRGASMDGPALPQVLLDSISRDADKVAAAAAALESKTFDA